MYKKKRNHQFSFTDFNQPLGFKMNPDNRWVRKAELIPWDEIEEKYAALFPSITGNEPVTIRNVFWLIRYIATETICPIASRMASDYPVRHLADLRKTA